MVPNSIHETTCLVHQQVERLSTYIIKHVESKNYLKLLFNAVPLIQVQGELQNVVSQIITQTQHVLGQQMDRLIAHTSQSLR